MRVGGRGDNIYILLVYKASGAVVSRTIWGVPPKKANTSPPNVCEYRTFSTSEITRKFTTYMLYIYMYFRNLLSMVKKTY